MILSSSTHRLRLQLSSVPVLPVNCTVYFQDINQVSGTIRNASERPKTQTTASIDLLSAPALDVERIVKGVNISNPNVAPVIVTILDAEAAGTSVLLPPYEIAARGVLTWNPTTGWGPQKNIKGDAGVSVSKTEIINGRFIVTLSTGQSSDVGQATGSDGVSIVAADIDVSGGLKLLRSDGTVLITAPVKGDKGDKGDPGGSLNKRGVYDAAATYIANDSVIVGDYEYYLSVDLIGEVIGVAPPANPWILDPVAARVNGALTALAPIAEAVVPRDVPDRTFVFTAFKNGERVELGGHHLADERWSWPYMKSRDALVDKVVSQTLEADTLKLGNSESVLTGLDTNGLPEIRLLDRTRKYILGKFSGGANTFAASRETNRRKAAYLHTGKKRYIYGVAPSLADYERLMRMVDQGLSSPYRNMHCLRNLKATLAMKRAGLAIGQFAINFIGDSNTRYAEWLMSVAAYLREAMGDAGPGFVGQNVPNEWNRASGVIDPVTGMSEVMLDDPSDNWQPGAGYVGGPTTGYFECSTSGDPLRYYFPNGVIKGMVLYYVVSVGAAARYRWSAGGVDGAWKPLDLGVGLVNAVANVVLDAPPNTNLMLRLDIERTAATIRPAGLRPVTEVDGVIINNLGRSGSLAQTWASVNRAQFIDNLKPLGAQTHFVALGTNDIGSKSAFKALINEMCDRLEEMRADNSPAPDIALMASPEHFYGAKPHTLKMGPYRDALREIADDRRYALFDLIEFLGQPGVDYGSNDVPARFNLMPDGLHYAGRNAHMVGEFIARGILYY